MNKSIPYFSFKHPDHETLWGSINQQATTTHSTYLSISTLSCVQKTNNSPSKVRVNLFIIKGRKKTLA